MKKINDVLTNIHSLFIGLSYFDIKTAIKIPVLFDRKLKIIGAHKGGIILKGEPSYGQVKLGTCEGSVGIWRYDKCSGILDTSGGSVKFGNNVTVCKGFTLKTINDSNITIGDNTYLNNYCKLLAKKKISIGKNVLIGWNTSFNDGDGHDVISVTDGAKLNSNKPIKIGDHVWIAADVSIMKGTEIANDCIIAYRSTVGKAFKENNIIIGGEYPSRIVKRGINWK